MFRYDAGIEWMRLINEVFNNRLKFGNRSLILYGISMFGKKNMEWIGNGLDSAGNKSAKTYLWVDNFYISILQRFGIFLTVITSYNYNDKMFENKEVLFNVYTYSDGRTLYD